MQPWRCSCGAPLRLNRVTCSECHKQLVFDPAAGHMRPATLADRPNFCGNRPHDKLGCNWVRDDGPSSLCYACGLTSTTPVLDIKSNRNAFRRFEANKRRLVVALLRIGLLPRHEVAPDGARLKFHLKQDKEDNPNLAEDFVMTGHTYGNITLNTRETDRVRIETTRRTFNEKYRTTLGTLRHEVGHFFFHALVEPDGATLGEFRSIFGDETSDYAQAMERYYANRKNTRRQSDMYISSYAMSHPHEDWAETWAHYMHMEDALAVASRVGVALAEMEVEGDRFVKVMHRWENIARIMNAFNLSMGHSPAYPFRLTKPVMAKMRFVAGAIEAAGGRPFVEGAYNGQPGAGEGRIN